MSRPAVAKRPSAPVSSVENALRLLVAMRDRESIRVSEASAELGVSRSTAHRLLAMLSFYELLEHDPGGRAYRPGPALAELGLSALRQDDMLTALHPFLQQLSDAVQETAHVIVLEGRNCRFVDSIECRQALRTTARTGIVYPAYVTSGGKALLAALDDERLEQLFPEEDLVPLNPRSLTSRAELFAELDQVRAAGYATNRGESEMGIAAVAMVQRTARGVLAAALAVSAPEQRLPEERVPLIVEALRDVTERARLRLP